MGIGSMLPVYTEDMLSDADRIRAGLWGVLVGDALGVPHEFKSSITIQAAGEPEMIIRTAYEKTFAKVPYGTWSDDGSLTLALADSLARKGTLDTDDFGSSLVRWFTKSAYTPDGRTFDVGNTTQEAILRIMRGHEAEKAGLTQESANGNGSLMRTLPLALFHKGTDEELYRDACRASTVTHGHDVSQAACGVYCVAARNVLRGMGDVHSLVVGLKMAHVPLKIPTPTGSGYVLDSLGFAIDALRSGESYANVVKRAIWLGNDTDTTAAIAGGLVALRDGLASIPEPWMRDLRGKDVATPIIESFVAACA